MIKHRNIVIIATATILSAMLRFWSSFDDLWIDEIWSLRFANTLANFWDVFNIHRDNNHILNTIYLFFFGNGTWWPQYRFFSIITGTAAVVVVNWLGFRKGFLEGILTAVLTVFSIPLILYSSEARGYAPAILFSVLAFAAFQNYGRKESFHWVMLFWLSSVLGILSHLTFFYVFGAFFISSVFYAGYGLKNIASQWKKLLIWYSVPAIFMTVFLLSWIDIELWGGLYVPPGLPRFSLFMSSMLGLPRGLLSTILGIYTFVATIFWIYGVERRRGSIWLFYGSMAVLMPVIGFLGPFPFFDSRYLALSLPFFYLLLASLLAAGIRRFNIISIVCFALLAIFIFGNINMLKDHLKFGRGNYMDAVSYIIRESRGPTVSIISDHDFRNRVIIHFYAQFVESDKKIEYMSRNEQIKDKDKPEWLIQHNFDRSFSPPQNVSWFDKKYRLERVFNHAGILSGWSWYIYHKQ